MGEGFFAKLFGRGREVSTDTDTKGESVADMPTTEEDIKDIEDEMKKDQAEDEVATDINSGESSHAGE